MENYIETGKRKGNNQHFRVVYVTRPDYVFCDDCGYNQTNFPGDHLSGCSINGGNNKMRKYEFMMNGVFFQATPTEFKHFPNNEHSLYTLEAWAPGEEMEMPAIQMRVHERNLLRKALEITEAAHAEAEETDGPDCEHQNYSTSGGVRVCNGCGETYDPREDA